MANKDFMDPELTEEEKEDMIIKRGLSGRSVGSS